MRGGLTIAGVITGLYGTQREGALSLQFKGFVPVGVSQFSSVPLSQVMRGCHFRCQPKGGAVIAQEGPSDYVPSKPENHGVVEVVHMAPCVRPARRNSV
jgi:hypothetical protein